MEWRQLITPNYEITEQAGMCLSYSRRTFGLPAVEPTAYEALKRLQFFHGDRNFPNASVPVWFQWWGDLGSGYMRYDHVAVRDKGGRVWSSPLTGRGRAWFATVDDLVRSFGNGMKYLGWSEDISGYRVAKEVEMAEKATLSTMRILAHGIWGQNGLPTRQNVLLGTDDEYFKANWVGMELTNANIEKFFYQQQAKQWRDSQDDNSLFGIAKQLDEGKQAKNQVKELEAKLAEKPAESTPAADVTLLKPGTYEVK